MSLKLLRGLLQMEDIMICFISSNLDSCMESMGYERQNRHMNMVGSGNLILVDNVSGYPRWCVFTTKWISFKPSAVDAMRVRLMKHTHI